MSTAPLAYTSRHAFSYVSARGMPSRQRALVGLLIVAVHAAVFGGLLTERVEESPAVEQQPMMVSFVASQPEPQPEPPAAVVKPPEPPPPVPVLMSTPKPTPAAIVTPPAPEEIVEQALPEPPQAAASTAGPPQETLTPPDYLAAYLNNPGPQYPLTSRRRREEGVVMLKVLVSAGGVAEQVLVDSSSGFADLDNAAADIVKKRWRFVPAKEGDLAVAAWVTVPVSFSLKKS
ncbi:TonB family protein [Povalibacter sp.]|uniref:energy transducer TonB n=1 Tax=Povalibacter sp. TaxID=1962978 RepID=UPI002F42397C